MGGIAVVQGTVYTYMEISQLMYANKMHQNMNVRPETLKLLETQGKYFKTFLAAKLFCIRLETRLSSIAYTKNV
jgi:hypothetical protein